MHKHKKFLSSLIGSSSRFIAVLLVGALLAVAGSVWATSIGTNVIVGGTLTVDGNSTFGNAAADVNLFTGTVQASTTALFTNGVITYGNSTFGDAAADINLFTGTLQASTTALLTGGVTFYGNLTFDRSATTTVTLSQTGLNFDADTFVIDPNSNRVGIGDLSPAALLTVGSGDLFQVDSSGRVFAPNGASGAGNLAYSFVNDTDVGFYRSAANELRVQTNGADRLTVDASGNLGVGTTTPNVLFQVAGLARPQLLLSDTGGGVDLKHIYASSTAGAWTWGVLNDALATFTERMRLTNGGNLGIGSTSPWGVASVEMTTTNPSFVVSNNGSTTPSLFVGGVNNDGRVGVYTSSPNTAFEVVGEASSTSLTVGSGVTTLRGNVTLNPGATTTVTFSGTGGINFDADTLVIDPGANRVGILTATPNTAFEVVGTASTTNLIVGGNGTSLGGVIAGFCTIPATTVNASTSAYADCANATGVRTTDRVLVMATSSLADNFVIQAASSTAANVINLRIFNLGIPLSNTGTGINSINFWAFR